MDKYNIKFITSSGTPAVIATQVYCVCYRAPNGSTTYYYVSEENWEKFQKTALRVVLLLILRLVFVLIRYLVKLSWLMVHF